MQIVNIHNSCSGISNFGWFWAPPLIIMRACSQSSTSLILLLKPSSSYHHHPYLFKFKMASWEAPRVRAGGWSSACPRRNRSPPVADAGAMVDMQQHGKSPWDDDVSIAARWPNLSGKPLQQAMRNQYVYKTHEKKAFYKDGADGTRLRLLIPAHDNRTLIKENVQTCR